jgi:nicotinate-nucleotide pyrophosphorylase (carboxylating)
MYHEDHSFWKELLIAGLKDDDSSWDWTSLGTIRNPTQKLRAKIIAKSHGIWAGQSLTHTLSQMPGIQKAASRLKDGQIFRPKTLLVEIAGTAKDVLTLERPFLNLASYASGIATRTHQLKTLIHQACPKAPPRLTLTRKTLPFYRDLAIHGVLAGGGHPHRVSLSGGVLIKENHIAAAGSIAKAIRGAKSVAPHGLKVEVEVRSTRELGEALKSGAEGVLLDNFTPAQVQSALKQIAAVQTRPVVEVSGGIDETNIADYSIEGIDVISVGSITHSVRSCDFSLLVHGV